MSFRTIASAVALASSLAACAGRDAANIPVVQPQDASLDCTAIQAETTANSTKLADLGRESGSKVAQNVAAGVAGVFIPVLWFAMDFKDATGKDTAALQARQNYLATLAAQKGCGGQAVRS
jgi:hypothetical protein